MRFVEVLGQSKDAAQKVGADFNRGLADTPGERLGFFDDENPELRTLAQQLDRARCPGQRAANDDDIVNALGCGRGVLRRVTPRQLNPPG